MRILASFFILFALLTEAAGQQLIQGMVADSASFVPLPYVNVFLKGRTKGTISDSEGKFKLVAESSDTLVISFVGYKTTEVPLFDWEDGIILLPERPTVLRTVVVEGQRMDPYGNMFDEENALWEEQNRKLPFYYSRRKKQTIRLGRLEQENLRVMTYVDVVIRNEETKARLMKTHDLSENQYYDILATFNAKHYNVMYYITAGELISLLNNFFTSEAKRVKSGGKR